MLAKYLGPIETDQEKGETFEPIKDFDGEISKSIGYYLKHGDNKTHKTIIKLMEELRQYLIQEKILFSDLNINNILLEKWKKDR